MINGFDPPAYMIRFGDEFIAGSYKIYKDLKHGNWCIEIFDKSGDLIKSAIRRTFDGCVNWLNRQEDAYEKRLG